MHQFNIKIDFVLMWTDVRVKEMTKKKECEAILYLKRSRTIRDIIFPNFPKRFEMFFQNWSGQKKNIE